MFQDYIFRGTKQLILKDFINLEVTCQIVNSLEYTCI